MSGRLAWLTVVALIAPPRIRADNCFVPLAKPLPSLPFNETAVTLMRGYFKANLNIRGTGAIVASPGECPALTACCRVCEGGYAYDWTRDGAISVAALQKLARSSLATSGGRDLVTAAYVSETVQAYAAWVGRRAGDAVFLEPKWNISTGRPYGGGWCRPQTDGPGLRAMALMQFAREHRSLAGSLWSTIRADLDWVSNHGIARKTCDLWEETVDTDFLWNRLTMRAALLHGHQFARDMDDEDRAELYLRTVDTHLGDPLAKHTEHQRGFLTECATEGSGLGCRLKRKLIDGSVILSLVHGGWPPQRVPTRTPLTWPTSAAVARTVLAYNQAFCSTYSINRKDSEAGVPGVLYGRYARDVYGRGNPWVLITAALAHLLYRAGHVAAAGGSLSREEVRSWRVALNWSGFEGSSRDFVAAGDAVMLRIAHHAKLDDWHLFEQIDKDTGRQYNAKDLTWSYAEVLSALAERGEAAGQGAADLAV